jgi:phosphoglycerate dehydrogenase-like enzyme
VLTVLVAIHHRVVAWTIPDAYVSELQRRFPRVRFLRSQDCEADQSLAPQADVVFALAFTRDAATRATRLRWIHASGHAVGHFPLADLASRGIALTNSRGIQATPIAEHVMACLLALARQLPDALRRQGQRAWAPNDLVGPAAPWLLSGRTLGIIGLGSLGQAIATRAKAFGMRVVGARRHPERGAPPSVDQVVAHTDLDDMLEQADVVVLAAPWTPESDRLLDARAMARMKAGALVINVARGQLLDEAALVSALESGKLGGAALDVFATEPLPPDSPLWSMRNVIITPHSSGFRLGHFDAVIDLFAENLRRFERGEDLLNRVDLQAGY